MIKTITSILLLCPSLLFAQTWGQISSMPIGKHHPVTFSLDGKGYAISGTSSSNFATDDVYQYNPVNNQWTSLSDFPGPDRSFAIGQAYNGKGYMGFGLASNFSYLNDIWEYDPVTNTWDQLTTCDCNGRRHPAFIIKDDKIYIGLGDDVSGDVDDWHIYDMNTDTWTQQDDLPAAGRHHPFMFPAGDHVYAGMGHSGNIIYDDWYKFDVNTNTWEAMADFPGEARVAGTQFGHQNKGYVLSGDGSNHSFMPTGEFWEYDPDMDSWTELTPHPGISRWAPGSFVINGAVYFMGGENRQSTAILNDAWTYQLTSPSSVGDIDNSDAIQFYPNPTDGILNINNQLGTNSTIAISNIAGQVVYNSSLSQTNQTIDLSSLNAGVYMVSVENENQLIRKKLIIQ